MKLYQFTVTLNGYGDTPEEAWKDMQEHLDIDECEMVEDYEIIDEEIED